MLLASQGFATEKLRIKALSLSVFPLICLSLGRIITPMVVKSKCLSVQEIGRLRPRVLRDLDARRDRWYFQPAEPCSRRPDFVRIPLPFLHSRGYRPEAEGIEPPSGSSEIYQARERGTSVESTLTEY